MLQGRSTMSRTRHCAVASHFLGVLCCGNHSASALALIQCWSRLSSWGRPTPSDDHPFPNPISPRARAKSSSRKTGWVSKSPPGVVLDSSGAGKAPCNRRHSETRGFRHIEPAVTRGSRSPPPILAMGIGRFGQDVPSRRFSIPQLVFSMARIKLLALRLLSPEEHQGEGARNSAGSQGLGFLPLGHGFPRKEAFLAGMPFFSP